MNQQETAAVIEAVHQLWPTVPFQARIGADTVRVWQLVLADIPFLAAEALILARSRRGDPFPPPPGEIARTVIDARRDLDGSAAPDPDQAWAEISVQVRRVGWYRGAGSCVWSHPAVAAVVAALGWDELCHGDVMVMRAHFMRLYTPAVDRVERQRRTVETIAAVGGTTFEALLPAADLALGTASP